MAETASKKDAQKRVDRIRAFREEMAQLAREGALVLTDEQRLGLDRHLETTLAELAHRFDVDINASQKQFSLVMRIASTLGGLAFCAAAVLFFYRYWGFMSAPFQVAVLVAAPVLSLIAADVVSRKEKTYYYTDLLVLLALAAFILNLSVLGSMFNIAATPGAFLAWGMLALTLAYRYRLRLPLAGGLIAVVIYLAATLTSLSGGFWGAMLERPETFFPGAWVLLSLSLASRPAGNAGFLNIVFPPHGHAEFVFIYRSVAWLFLFLTLLLLGNEGQFSYLAFPKAAEGIYQFLGFVAAVAAIWIGLRQQSSESVNLGAVFFAVFLFNRLFVWWWDWMPRYLFFLIIGIIALALLAAFRRLRSRPAGPEAL